MDIMKKTYMSEKELVDRLVTEKNIDRETIPTDIFKERGYTTLINPYKKLICINYSCVENRHIYKKEGNFKDFLAMAQTDDYISTKLSLYINYFEKRLKSYVSEKLAEMMKETSIFCNDYSEFYVIYKKIPKDKKLKFTDSSHTSCHYNCYNLLNIDEMYDEEMRLIPATTNIISNRKNAIKKLIKVATISNETSNILVNHLYQKGEIPPVWVSIHTLSLGDVLAIYNLLRKEDRFEFCKIMLNKDRIRNKEIANISSKIDTIRKIRNTINHYEPLIPFLLDIEKEEIEKIIMMLKNNYTHSYCKSIKISRTKILNTIVKNEYNSKYITKIENIINLL